MYDKINVLYAYVCGYINLLPEFPFVVVSASENRGNMHTEAGIQRCLAIHTLHLLLCFSIPVPVGAFLGFA